MKKIFLLSILALFIIPTFAQNTDSIQRIKVLSVGTSQLVNGSIKINLEFPSDNYYVILTPVGEYSQLYIFEKSEKNFTVMSVDNSNAKFEYVVIDKKVKYRLSEGSGDKVQ